MTNYEFRLVPHPGGSRRQLLAPLRHALVRHRQTSELQLTRADDRQGAGSARAPLVRRIPVRRRKHGSDRNRRGRSRPLGYRCRLHGWQSCVLRQLWFRPTAEAGFLGRRQFLPRSAFRKSSSERPAPRICARVKEAASSPSRARAAFRMPSCSIRARSIPEVSTSCARRYRPILSIALETTCKW